ncbi:Thioredoxin H-type [Morella rubra]|uniref:Thioredoxin H-type n=1 Tax=Morella rubra TaxID=262757 RepID=A0A6A1UN65_9ROSI|nr:Thioredoxin H-type [Morella rubra]
MGVIVVSTEKAWKEQLQRAKSAKTPTLVEFFCHSWGSASSDAVPVVAELASKYADATFLKVNLDVDVLMAVAEEWAVTATPSFFFLKEGNIVAKVAGSEATKLREAADKHLLVPGISRRYNVIRSHN